MESSNSSIGTVPSSKSSISSVHGNSSQTSIAINETELPQGAFLEADGTYTIPPLPPKEDYLTTFTMKGTRLVGNILAGVAAAFGSGGAPLGIVAAVVGALILAVGTGFEILGSWKRQKAEKTIKKVYQKVIDNHWNALNKGGSAIKPEVREFLENQKAYQKDEESRAIIKDMYNEIMQDEDYKAAQDKLDTSAWDRKASWASDSGQFLSALLLCINNA